MLGFSHTNTPYRIAPPRNAEPGLGRLEDRTRNLRGAAQGEAADLAIGDEMVAEPTTQADGPGPAHLAADVVVAEQAKPAARRERLVIGAAAHAGKPPFAADRLQQVSRLPGRHAIPLEPGTDDQPAARLQHTLRLGEEARLVDHVRAELSIA